jgi:translocation and assembly module TamB
VLRVSTQNFPIAFIKELAPAQTVIASGNNVLRAIASQRLVGDISGNVDVNLKTFEVSLNEVALSGPIFEPARGSEIQPGNNRYVLSGKITQTATGPQFQNVQLNVEQGELQVVLAALQLLDAAQARTSFGDASEVLVSPVRLQDEPLQRQLQRLSEIKVLLDQQREQREASSLFPDLNLAKGSFTGTVNLDGSLASGFTTQFNIEGQNWEWGSYGSEQLTVTGEGSFQNGIISLLPLRIQSGESVISYSGTIGGEVQSAQLRLENIPIEQMQALLQKVPNLPPVLTGFSGLLNATATLSGSISNPQARGELSITDAAINRTPVQSAEGSFSYANARLNFGSTILVAGTEPLNINGSLPYKLPIASVEPENNQLNLNIDVKNEGLAVLNLLSGGQVTWLNGTGNARVDVRGIYDQKANKLEQLVAQGEANIENATIQARPLPEGEPLTNVNGRVLFDFDRILVENMQGQFGGGAITAAGSIPISQPAPQQNPLTVNIGELAINLKGLYRGHVRGDVVVTGAALVPKIGGELNLFDGQVQLAAGGTATNNGGATGGGATASGGGTTASGATARGRGTTGTGAGSNNQLEFNSLKLTLDKSIEITQAPILSFLAQGTLTLNGPLDSIKPEGTIELNRGQVNLFTTQFRLARDYENTARFVANRGLDPILDVRLIASVTESTQRRLPISPVSAEINDAPALGVGSVQTVRIQARALGPASQLADNLELTSSPGRSKAEIVALLGGSFVDTLGRGDSTLGLVNLAGSALLGNVQNLIGDALGLSEFRVFPTTINDDKRRTSTLGLAAEAGVDISRNFSVSVLKELTTDQPFQYNLRYRVNDKVLLRGGTDFSGDSRAVVEYENRF